MVESKTPPPDRITDPHQEQIAIKAMVRMFEEVK